MFAFQIPFELIQIFGYVSIDTCWTLLGCFSLSNCWQIENTYREENKKLQISNEYQTANYQLWTKYVINYKCISLNLNKDFYPPLSTKIHSSNSKCTKSIVLVINRCVLHIHIKHNSFPFLRIVKMRISLHPKIFLEN